MPEIVFSEETEKQILQYLEAIYSQIRWLYLDDSSRLVTRVGYLDDGYIRLRLDGHWEFTGELLRELSWVIYSFAESNKYLQNLDVSLSVLARLIKFNRDASPMWIYGSEISAPPSNTSLVSKTVSQGKRGYIYGVFISAGEANDFKIEWSSSGTRYSVRIPTSSKGAIYAIYNVPLNEGLPADEGTAVAIKNVNAGGFGVIYQAGILYLEV
jgi:hypothetical protein